MNDLRTSQLRLARAKRNGDPDQLRAAEHDHAVLKVRITFEELKSWFDKLSFDEKQAAVETLFGTGGRETR